MSPWNQGRAEIDRMLVSGELEQVTPSRDLADRFMAQATRNLSSVEPLLAAGNPSLAYSALYDAARMALTAMLANQGLRPTRSGGHLAVYYTAKAQLVPPMATTVNPFDAMRRRRHQGEYGSDPDNPDDITTDEVRDDAPREGDRRHGDR